MEKPIMNKKIWIIMSLLLIFITTIVSTIFIFIQFDRPKVQQNPITISDSPKEKADKNLKQAAILLSEKKYSESRNLINLAISDYEKVEDRISVADKLIQAQLMLYIINTPNQETNDHVKVEIGT